MGKSERRNPIVRSVAADRAAEAMWGPATFEAALRGLPTGTGCAVNEAALFSGYCASCHQSSGAGSPNQAYPSLFYNISTGANQADNLISTIFYGVDRDVG